MKIKIGDKVYDSAEQPIMVILTDSDKKNIKNMIDTATKYCSYPDSGFTEEEITKFMEIE